MIDSRMLDIPGVENLKEKILPPALLVEGVITDRWGVSLYGNYEEWARELISNSLAFMAKTDGERFRAPEEGESFGQPDAITDKYCIDFKLVLGQSALNEISDYSR